MKRISSLIVVVMFFMAFLSCCKSETSQQTSFEKELAWWKDARYGMFIHWGISSLLGWEISWSRNNYGPEKYDRLAQRFNPVDFDADKWITIAENAGMKYMVLTAKHHDGYCLWDSKVNPHNIVNSPYGKDVCAQLSEAAHRRGMRLGWYFSVREWNDSTCNHETLNHLYVEKIKSEITELLSNYGKIDIMWFDYEGTASSADPQAIFNLCRELQPDIIINNRIHALNPEECFAYVGTDGMFATPEQFIGAYGDVPWETTTTSSSSRQWAIRYNDPPRPSNDLLWDLIGASGGNGNLLMNVGPDSTGVILPDYADSLAVVGKWIKENDGVIYGTTGGPWKPTTTYMSTRKDKTINLILKTASDISLPYSSELAFEKAYILSNNEEVNTVIKGDTILFSIPEDVKGKSNLVIRLETKSNANNISLLPPFSTSGSLAYNKKVKASSSLSENYMYNPEAAVDDDPRTLWIVGRRKDIDSVAIFGHLIHCLSDVGIALFNDSGELEIDLGEPKEVKRFMVIANSSREIANAYIEYENNSKWVTVAVKHNVKENEVWEDNISNPVNARKWRIRLSGGGRLLGVKEFQLF